MRRAPTLAAACLALLLGACATFGRVESFRAVEAPNAPQGLQAQESYAESHQSHGWALGWTWRF
jgi:hypothetical protein